MTFAQFNTAVKASVFPEGEADNLVTQDTDRVKDALIDLQTKVPQLQEQHTQHFAFSDTWFDCGASTVEKPDGTVFRVWTILTSDPCARVYYDPLTWEEMECRIKQASGQCGCPIRHPTDYYYLGPYYRLYPDGPEDGFEYPNSGEDMICRSKSGSVALHRDWLYLYPGIQSTETVVVEWDGIKRVWNDSDVLNSLMAERRVQQAVENYLASQAAMWRDNDPKKQMAFLAQYNENVSMLRYQYRKENRLPRAPRSCFACG